MVVLEWRGSGGDFCGFGRIIETIEHNVKGRVTNVLIR